MQSGVPKEGLDSLPCFDALRSKAAKHEKVVVAVCLFPHFEMLDAFGPLEMLGAAAHLGNNIEVVTVALSTEGLSVRSNAGRINGPQILTDCNYIDCPDADIILLPGGLGTRALALPNNAAIDDFIRQKADAAAMVISVCTGSALLAKVGLLDGRKATTNKNAFKWVTQQGPAVDWQDSARWVEDGKFLTSSGVSAGTDLSLYAISQIYGLQTSRDIASFAEYTWCEDADNDPFALSRS